MSASRAFMFRGTPTCRARSASRRFVSLVTKPSASIKVGVGRFVQAARLPGATPRLELLLADRKRQQAVAHGLCGAVAFVDQRRRRRQSSEPYFSSGTSMTTSAEAIARRVEARIIASRVVAGHAEHRVAHALTIREIPDVDGDHAAGSHRLHDIGRHVVHGAAIDRAPVRSPAWAERSAAGTWWRASRPRESRCA